MEDAAMNAHGNNQFEFHQLVSCFANELSILFRASRGA